MNPRSLPSRTGTWLYPKLRSLKCFACITLSVIVARLLYFRRLVPLAIAHALMDGASVLIGVLLPLVRA
jgi:hypothetical protein